MLWAEKYSPQSLKEVAGNEPGRQELEKWALEFERGKTAKPLLIHGPPGVGKTAVAHALARQYGWTVTELNASDMRSAQVVDKIAGATAGSKGLYGETRLILIDEVDSVADRGEYPALLRVLKDARQPIILTANDYWNPKLSAIRLACKPLELKKVNSSSVLEALEKIAEKEKIEAGELAKQIAKNSAGDLRGAINDFQACARGKFVTASRERRQNMFEAVRRVLKAQTFGEAVETADSVDEKIDAFLLWVEENIANEYEDAEEIAKAYDRLSRADVFLGRIKKTRDWGFWKYAKAMGLAGVALSKKKQYYKYAAYSFPALLKSMGQSRASRALLKSAAAKIGAKTHSSSAKARTETAPFLDVEKSASFFGFEDGEKSLLAELYKNGADNCGKAKH